MAFDVFKWNVAALRPQIIVLASVKALKQYHISCHEAWSWRLDESIHFGWTYHPTGRGGFDRTVSGTTLTGRQKFQQVLAEGGFRLDV